MNKQKIPYEVPEAQSFVVRCEGVVCQSPVYNSNGTQKGRAVTNDWNDWDDEE